MSLGRLTVKGSARPLRVLADNWQNLRPTLPSALQPLRIYPCDAKAKLRGLMSYRPNYSESWRPPQQRDSWRPSRELPDCEAGRPYADTHKRYEAEDRPLIARHLPSARGDSWRPYMQEEHTLIRREEDHDHGRENAAARPMSHRSLGCPRQTFSLPTRPAISASDPPRSYLNPSVTEFQPGDIRPNSIFNHAAPASLRLVQNQARYSPIELTSPTGRQCLRAILPAGLVEVVSTY